MADLYYARIELYGATEKNYESLRDKMNALGWSRAIKQDGVSTDLPNATYAKNQDGTTAASVLASLTTAVDGLKVSPDKSACILVIKAADSRIRGHKAKQ